MQGLTVFQILPDYLDFEDMGMMPTERRNEIPIIIRDKSGKYQGVRCVELSDELLQEYRDAQFRADYEPSECERWLRRARI